jgi:uroporphyrinogen decarboxylase
MLTPRENLLGLYRRQGYAYAPVALSLCPSLRETYKTIAGDTPMAEYFDYPQGFAIRGVPGLRLRPREPVDWSVYFGTPLKEGTRFDAYGVAHEPGSEAAKHMTYMRHPLARATSLEELQAYPFPEYDTEDTGHLREAVAKAHASGKAAVGGMQCTIWETAWYIRDMTQLMMDMLMEDEKATFMLDKITEHACQRAAAFAEAGADIIELGDDIGMQSTIMMSKAMYEEWLKPRLVRVIAAARARNPDLLIFYHTCGFVEPLIDSLMEAGVDILNPVQPECMAFSEIHEKYGDRLSFNGTLGTQTTMPFGTPEEVKATVFRNLEIAGPAGGLFCCPTHLLEPEVPWANVVAYVAACKEFSTAGS